MKGRERDRQIDITHFLHLDFKLKAELYCVITDCILYILRHRHTKMVTEMSNPQCTISEAM